VKAVNDRKDWARGVFSGPHRQQRAAVWDGALLSMVSDLGSVAQKDTDEPDASPTDVGGGSAFFIRSY
jgi:hypothetical protein